MSEAAITSVITSAEAALGVPGPMLQAILDGMDSAILVADGEQRLFLFNAAAEEMFGPGLVQGAFTLHQADRVTPLPVSPLVRAGRGETFDEMEVYVRPQDAPRGRWVSMTGRPLRERGGSIQGSLLICRDITERKRGERRLKAQYEVARVLAERVGLHETASRLLQVLCDALEWDIGVLWSVDAARQALVCLEVWHVPLLELGPFVDLTFTSKVEPGKELAGRVWQEGRSSVWSAAANPWSENPRWQAARAAGLRQVRGYPIRAGSDTVGVLVFWARKMAEDADDPALHFLMQALGSQVGQFLQQQQLGEALRDSQVLYESLVQNLPQNIFRKDRSGRFTFGNARICAMLGRTPEELLGKTDFDLFPQEQAEHYVRDDQTIMSSGQTLDTVEQLPQRDGSTLYIHTVKTPIRDAHGDIIGVQGIFWDETAKVRALEALTQSERRYRQLTEATMDGILVADESGRIILFNPAAERMFGWGAEEVLGESAARLLPGFLDGHTGPLDRAQLGQPHEVRGVRKDGTDFPVEIALSILGDGKPEQQKPGLARVLAALRDLTERQRMQAVLVQNEKLASIGLLSAGVAHEINNPLAFVANNLAVLERDCTGLLGVLDLYESGRPKLAAVDAALAQRIADLTEDADLPYVRDNLGRILNRTRDGVDRVTRIVHSLRGMARTEAVRRQETRLPDLVLSSLEILHGRFKRLGVVIEQEHDPNPTVACVPTQISQVVLNLLVNAFQALETSGKTDGRIAIRTRRLPTAMLLEVADNGPGVDPNHLPRLFDPFFTTKEVGVGTGLGLSITHHIVTAHGGRIEVDSQPGQGATFRVYLPLDGRKEA